MNNEKIFITHLTKFQLELQQNKQIVNLSPSVSSKMNAVNKHFKNEHNEQAFQELTIFNRNICN